MFLKCFGFGYARFIWITSGVLSVAGTSLNLLEGGGAGGCGSLSYRYEK